LRKIAIVSMALVVMVSSSLVASTVEAAPADNRVSWDPFADVRTSDNQDVTRVVTVPFNILVHNVSAIVEMSPLEPTATFAQARIVVTRSDGYLLHQFHVDRYRDPAGLSDIFRKDPIAPPVSLLEGDTITVVAGCSTRDAGVTVLFGLWVDGTSF
jgi:hypothetical protein